MLELVADSPQGLTLTEIASGLDLPPSSAHGLVGTLADAAYLRRAQGNMRYHLGPRLGKLAAAFHTQVDLISLSGPIMDRLQRVTGETVSLTVMQGDQIMFIDKRTTNGQIQVVNPTGTRLPAYATGSGKAMLALLPREALLRLYPEAALPPRTRHTLTSRQDLEHALQAVRRQGYALDQQESEVGVWAAAAAIRDAGGGPVGALSVFAPIFRVQAEQSAEWIEHVSQGAAEVSSLLGYPGEAPDRMPHGKT
jgi:IclR family acetate operon transcriptional repressor